MEKSKKSINVEGGFLFFGGWHFSKSVSVGSTIIRDMRESEIQILNRLYGPGSRSQSVYFKAKPQCICLSCVIS